MMKAKIPTVDCTLFNRQLGDSGNTSFFCEFVEAYKALGSPAIQSKFQVCGSKTIGIFLALYTHCFLYCSVNMGGNDSGDEAGRYEQTYSLRLNSARRC